MIGNRIRYIDAMRGFTMFLVVYSHVMFWTFRKTSLTGWSVSSLFATFRMPLFFFVSGFLMYKKNAFYNKQSLGSFLRKKGRVQLIPTFFFSAAFLFIHQVSYKTFFLDGNKCGFWFTITLFYFFLLYGIGDYLIDKFTRNSRIKGLVGFLIAICVFGFAKYSVLDSCPWRESKICDIIGIAHFRFFIFFYLGALVRANYGKLEHMMDSDVLSTLAVSGFIVLQMIIQPRFLQTWFLSTTIHHLLYTLLYALAGFVGIVLIFILFRKNEAVILRSRVGTFLQYVGQRTLDVYLIHTMFIYTDLHFVGRFLDRYNSIICDLLFGGSIAIVLVVLSLVISQIIRSSDYLAKLLFGKVIR